MKTLRATWTGIALATLSPLAAQQQAFRGSLAEYLALDEEGVMIGASTFHNFRALPLQQGAIGLSSLFIDVVPLTGTEGKPGFRFEIMDGATIDDFFELRFAFDASGPGFVGSDIKLENVDVRASSNAGADVILDLSDPDKRPGSLATLIAFAAPGGFAMLEDWTVFPRQSDLSIEVDAVLDGGNEGTPGAIVASLAAVSVTFTEAPPIIEAPVVSRSGLGDGGLFFIEFTSAPSTFHTLMASTNLADDFPISVIPLGGSLTTDANGFARVEIDLSTFPSSTFFSVKASS